MSGEGVWLPAIIPRRKYRIPSALRSQAPLGWQSTVVGDDTGTASVAGLYFSSFFLSSLWTGRALKANYTVLQGIAFALFFHQRAFIISQQAGLNKYIDLCILF